MEPRVEKRDALKRAEELLAQDDADSLRYVALELRRCVEAVVYEKLWAYRDRIPAEAARTWQPPQAFKALVLMEPGAASTSRVGVAPQKELGVPPEGPYHPLGVDVRPGIAWLNKTFNKLGSFLHADWPYSRKKPRKRGETGREYLESVVQDLRPFVEKSFTSTLALLVTFHCSVCGTEIRANAAGVEAAGEVTCLNADCGCRFLATKENDQILFQLDATVANCPECEGAIELPNQKLRIGHTFACAGCGVEYEIVEQGWHFNKCGSQDPG